jgi:hypothetical protein
MWAEAFAGIPLEKTSVGLTVCDGGTGANRLVSDRQCPACGMWFRGPMCPRCDYQQSGRMAAMRRGFAPYHTGRRSKPGDSEVRVSRESSLLNPTEDTGTRIEPGNG